jgi:DNA modification methylase
MRTTKQSAHSPIGARERPAKRQPETDASARSSVLPATGLPHAALEHLPVSALRPYPNNARTHSAAQIRQIAASIRRFGFTNPVLIGEDGIIVAGHGRVRAAAELGLEHVPCLRLAHLSAAELRAYILADNKLAENAGWDRSLLALELQGLSDLNFDLTLTGFSLAEIDFTLDAAREANPGKKDEGRTLLDGAEDDIPPRPVHAITQTGDLWLLGRHRLLCGDARSAADYQRLLAFGPDRRNSSRASTRFDVLRDRGMNGSGTGERVEMIFTDPPYNVPIAGNVSGLGRHRHREFALASGEMSEAAFTGFLTESLSAMANTAQDGAIAFVCMDWRHMGEMLAAGHQAFGTLKNLCVWAKSNGGMGTFYRSRHELVFVWKIGTASHINSFGLGDTGRYRTNVWEYPGVSSLGAARDEALAMHPTVKPVALVADAMRDCSYRGGIVLDGFAGSGTTLIAAEICGRKARAIEMDEAYCDVAVLRWQRITGKVATLAATGESFEEIGERREREAKSKPPGASVSAALMEPPNRSSTNRRGKMPGQMKKQSR